MGSQGLSKGLCCNMSTIGSNVTGYVQIFRALIRPTKPYFTNVSLNAYRLRRYWISGDSFHNIEFKIQNRFQYVLGWFMDLKLYLSFVHAWVQSFSVICGIRSHPTITAKYFWFIQIQMQTKSLCCSEISFYMFFLCILYETKILM